MSLNKNTVIHSNEDPKTIQKNMSSSFVFSPKETNRSQTSCSTSDSAYDSLVCSPFSPAMLDMRHKTASPADHETEAPVHVSISPYLDSGENEEVFKVSLEHICNDGRPLRPGYRTSNVHMDNTTFRPISSGFDNSLGEETPSLIQIRPNYRRSSFTSQRTISTQTRFSMSSMMMYRPSSAPLQEGVEEELDDLNIDGMVPTNYGIHRNYTCHCIRSPMPDLIQPTFHNNNQLIANRLSLIADQFDERINPVTSTRRNIPRTRRFSTPTFAELAPEGSFLDLLFSIYNAIDSTLPRRRRRREATNSFS